MTKALLQIKSELTQILKDKQSPTADLVAGLGAEALLLGGPLEIDSLDLASLIVAMEEQTTLRPFKDGFVMFHTLGELATLFGD